MQADQGREAGNQRRYLVHTNNSHFYFTLAYWLRYAARRRAEHMKAKLHSNQSEAQEEEEELYEEEELEDVVTTGAEGSYQLLC